MKVTSRQDDGSHVSYDSPFFPCTTIKEGEDWRVTLCMNGAEYAVVVKWCNERCLETTDKQRYLSNGVEEIKLFW